MRATTVSKGGDSNGNARGRRRTIDKTQMTLAHGALQSKCSRRIVSTEPESQTNHANAWLLDAFGPSQPSRCIIGKRRDETQIRDAGFALKKAFRLMDSRKFRRNSHA